MTRLEKRERDELLKRVAALEAELAVLKAWVLKAVQPPAVPFVSVPLPPNPPVVPQPWDGPFWYGPTIPPHNWPTITCESQGAFVNP